MEQFINDIQSKLVGKTIKSIRYMNDKEMADWGWNKRPLIILLSDKTFIIPQRDDEGNDGGAIVLVKEKQFTLIPTF